MHRQRVQKLELLDSKMHIQSELVKIGVRPEAELVEELREINKLLLELIKELQREKITRNNV